MSVTMSLLYAKSTRTVLGAVCVTAPPALGLQVQDLVTDSLSIRYLVDTNTAKLTTSAASFPPSELAVLKTDYDSGVVDFPSGFVLDDKNKPVGSVESVKVTRKSDKSLEVTSAVGARDFGGTTIFLRLALQTDDAMSFSKQVDVPVASTPTLSLEVALESVLSGSQYTVLGLATGLGPTLTQITF